MIEVTEFEFATQLFVAEKLLSSEHRFTFSGRKVTVCLPRYYTLGSDPQSKAQVGKREKGDGPVLAIIVFRVAVKIELTEEDKRVFNDRTTYSSELRQLSIELEDLAASAYNYWLRVYRYLSGDLLAGMVDKKTVLLTRFNALNASRAGLQSGPKIQGPPIVLDVSIQLDHLGERVWPRIGTMLANNEQPPVWRDLWASALHRHRDKEFRGAAIELAVAIEALIRNKFENSFSELRQDNEFLAKHLERMNISSILKNRSRIHGLRHWKLPGDQYSELNELFELRNKLLHGKVVSIEREDVDVYVSLAKQLIPSLEKLRS